MANRVKRVRDLVILIILAWGAFLLTRPPQPPTRLEEAMAAQAEYQAESNRFLLDVLESMWRWGWDNEQMPPPTTATTGKRCWYVDSFISDSDGECYEIWRCVYEPASPSDRLVTVVWDELESDFGTGIDWTEQVLSGPSWEIRAAGGIGEAGDE